MNRPNRIRIYESFGRDQVAADSIYPQHREKKAKREIKNRGGRGREAKKIRGNKVLVFNKTFPLGVFGFSYQTANWSYIQYVMGGKCHITINVIVQYLITEFFLSF
jgi:hypothetical protein